LAVEANIKAENIKEIVLSVTNAHYSLLCKPEEIKRSPRSPVDAQFSIPWGVAAAIVRRRVGLEDFSADAVTNRDMLEITHKMRVEVDNTLSRQDGVDPTRVTVTTKEGSVFSKEVESPLGSLERPMSFGDCARKFSDCAENLDHERTERIIELIGQLERLEDVREIIRLLAF
jgi:2-methylcitrate dehydratase PrpD